MEFMQSTKSNGAVKIMEERYLNFFVTGLQVFTGNVDIIFFLSKVFAIATTDVVIKKREYTLKS